MQLEKPFKIIQSLSIRQAESKYFKHMSVIYIYTRKKYEGTHIVVCTKHSVARFVQNKYQRFKYQSIPKHFYLTV